TESHVDIVTYENELRALIQRTKPLVKRIVLMTPFYIEQNTQDPMRSLMDKYGAVVRRIADEENTLFVDTQAAFEPLLKHMYSGALCWDRVHPSMAGHMALAKVFLNTIGFSWKSE
ncbi:GDSL-type esterase/lipase family protein, partial [Paenibacillus sp. TAF58]